MLDFFKSASLWGTRMKLLLVYLLIISGIGLLCYYALSYAVANKAVVSLDRQKETLEQTFNLGVDEYLSYSQSGDAAHLRKAVGLMKNANKRVYMLTRIDSLLRPQSVDKALLIDFLFISGENAESGMRDVRISQLLKLSRILPENMYVIQDLSRKAYAIGDLQIRKMESESGERSDVVAADFQSDLEDFVSVTAAFETQIGEMSNYIHRRILIVFALFVVMLILGFTIMLLYLVRSVSLKRIAQKEQWIQQSMSELDDDMRGNYSPGDLSVRIVQTLQTILGATVGALYYFDDVSQKLVLSGCSGINATEVKTPLDLGEGFAGQAAKGEGVKMICTKGKYHKFYGSTGEIIPEYVYLMPLHYNGELQGVAELASITELGDKQLKFLELCSERTAVALKSALMVARHNELLLQNKDQAEALQRQQFDLNVSISATLVREKALLDSMLKTLPDNVFFKDLDSKFIRISDSMVHFFGVSTPDEVVGKSDFDFQTMENAQKFYEEEQEIIKTGKGFYDAITKESDSKGNTVWSSISKLPLYDETGKCIGTFGISKNITNVKQLEESVLEQNEQLITQQKELQETIVEMLDTQETLKVKMAENDEMRNKLEWEKSLMDALLGNIPDAIYFKDRDSKFLKVSNSLARKFGITDPVKLEGLSDFDVHDKEHAAQAFDDEQKIIKSRTPVIGIVEQEKIGDAVKYVLTTKMPLTDHSGNVLGTFGISKDITELKQLEMEVSHQNEELMVQQEELRVTNDELNAQQEELRAANEEMQSQEEELRVTNEELEERGKELEIQRKEVVARNRDLLRAQNELLQKARDLELASQYKSEFLANMSHELRTPLNSLLILSKILSNNKQGNLTPEQIKSAHIIYNSGKDLLELINEVLDLSKIEAGKMSIELHESETSGIIKEMYQLFKPVADEKKLKLEVIQETGFPEVMVTDRQRLMQIIRNLLSNAFKFTSTGGITIRMGVPGNDAGLPPVPDGTPELYYISVTDTGVGIPKVKLNAIFEAFQQADGSISRKFGGTGLGLSISRQLVRLLGGEIRVESKEGAGSTFTVYLPLGSKDAVGRTLVAPENEPVSIEEGPAVAEAEGTEDAKAGFEEESPFFVEDDRDMETSAPVVLIIHSDQTKAKKIIKQCHKRNFHAVVAGNILDGIRLARKFRPRAIILSAELNVPSEFKRLNADDFTRGLPVHLVSRIEDETLDNFKELTTLGAEALSSLQNSINEHVSGINKILLVEDDFATRQTVKMLLSEKDVTITEATTAQQAYELLKSNKYECVILDLGLPDYSGKELLEKLKSEKIAVPNVIIHTARELSEKEFRELQKISSSIVVKGLKSDERLMDEVTLFLHHLSHDIPGAQAPKDIVPAEGNDGFQGKKILIVDDDIRNIFALAQVLEENGVEILEAENGQVALDMLELHNDIDLILMDLMMPEMDGFEAMKRIRAMEQFKDIPIITVSAKAMKEDHHKALEFGANDYISKPVDDSKLLSLLKIWLNK